MKPNRKLLILCIAVPLAVGGLAAWLTGDSMRTFAALNQPPLSPPAWVFPVVWTILYTLMGVASYLVLTSGKPRAEIESAMNVYALQLAFNFFWSILFFSMMRYLAAFIWLAVLWILILITALRFRKLSPAAGALLVPYLIWVAFAGYLNFAIYLLN